MLKRLFPVFFLIVFFISLFTSHTTSTAQEGCISNKCHPTLLKAKHVHPVAQPCETCHQSVDAKHPQKNKKTFKLMQDPPGLCSMCHGELGKKRNVHSPVKGGMCTTCHDPHASKEAKLLQQPSRKLCLMCHTGKLKHKYVHGPTATGDCSTCHAPHESDNSALTIKEGAELCYMCHVDMKDKIQKKYLHPALGGGCTSCHNPHGSPSKKLLSADGRKLCFMCHPQVQEQLKKATSIHPPVQMEQACASCHSPHSSDAPKLLAKTEKDLCLGCHPQVIGKGKKVLHGPIQGGSCTSCHNPHGSTYGKLLVNSFPTGFYVPYSDKQYKLCFTCHNRDLLRNPTTSNATGFRNGKKNLHYVHVNKKEKGRSCKSCHRMHASENKKLIADTLPFGNWKLPIQFEKKQTGGSCAPGCHKQYTYSRKAKAKQAASGTSKRKKK